MNGFLQRFQRRILAGVVLIVPIAVTFVVAAFIYNSLNRIVGPLVDHIFDSPIWQSLIGHPIPRLPGIKLIETITKAIMTILLTLILLYLIGLFSTTYVIRRAYVLGEQVVLKIPFIKSVYGLTKQIVDLVMNQDKNAFKQLAMVDYPRPGMGALAFVTGETRFRKDPRRFVNLFLPTTPNPTSGFMLVLSEDQVRTVDMTIEEGVKLIMSGGVIAPHTIVTHPYVPLNADPKTPSTALPGSFETGARRGVVAKEGESLTRAELTRERGRMSG